MFTSSINKMSRNKIIQTHWNYSIDCKMFLIDWGKAICFGIAMEVGFGCFRKQFSNFYVNYYYIPCLVSSIVDCNTNTGKEISHMLLISWQCCVLRMDAVSRPAAEWLPVAKSWTKSKSEERCALPLYCQIWTSWNSRLKVQCKAKTQCGRNKSVRKQMLLCIKEIHWGDFLLNKSDSLYTTCSFPCAAYHYPCIQHISEENHDFQMFYSVFLRILGGKSFWKWSECQLLFQNRSRRQPCSGNWSLTSIHSIKCI